MKVLRRGWFQILVGGLILLFLVEWALVATHNPNYIPSVIVLGAFLVPVAFVSYLYERLQHWGGRLQPVIFCFVWGGVLGTVVAGFLEYHGALPFGGGRDSVGCGLGDGVRSLRDDGLRVRLAAAVQRQPCICRLGAAPPRPAISCGARLLDGVGVRCAVAREAEGWTCCAELERGSRLLDRRDPARLVGYPGEQRKFYRRRVRCYGVSELAGGSDQPDFADPPRA